MQSSAALTSITYQSKQYFYCTWQQLQSAKLLQNISLCPPQRSDKISKVGPDILLDLLHSLFLPSKIGKFSNSKKNVHSLVNMTWFFFLVCMTNTVLNILTVLLDEVGNENCFSDQASGFWALRLCFVSWKQEFGVKRKLVKILIIQLFISLIFNFKIDSGV